MMGRVEITIRCAHCNDELDIRMVLVDRDQTVSRIRWMHVGERDGEKGGPSSRKRKGVKGACVGMMDYEVLDSYGEERVTRELIEWTRGLKM